MIQSRLKPLEIERVRPDYPQVDYIDDKGVQWIELNRGCKRQCEFCHADPNFKEFPIPEIRSRKVQIIGEGFLYDSRGALLIRSLPQKYKDRQIYYGLSQGLDYRLIDKSIAEAVNESHLGLMTYRAEWRKGIRLAWDLGIKQEEGLYNIIKLFDTFKFPRKNMMIFILANWKISLDLCLYKLSKLKDWGVMVDDCPWDCTKRLYIPQYWDYNTYRQFRRKCRTHNNVIRRGYNSEEHR